MKIIITLIILLLNINIANALSSDYMATSTWTNQRWGGTAWQNPNYLKDGNNSTATVADLTSLQIDCYELSSNVSLSLLKILYYIPTSGGSISINSVSNCTTGAGSTNIYTASVQGATTFYTSNISISTNKIAIIRGSVSVAGASIYFLELYSNETSFSNNSIPSANFSVIPINFSMCGWGDVLCGMGVIYNSAWNILYTIFDYFYYLLYSIFYIPIGIINSILNGFYLIATDIYGMITDVWGLGLNVKNFVQTTIGILYLNAWITLMTTGITLVILFRIYGLIRGSKT